MQSNNCGNKYVMQSNNCGMRVYVLGGRDFNFFSPLAFISAILKYGGRQYKCYHISNNRAIMFTLLDSVVDSDIVNIILHLQQHNNLHHF